MRVIKRNGKFEDVSFDKVIRRIRNIAANCGGLNGVELDEIAQKICSHIFDGVKTSELDELTGRLAASMITHHPDYGVLASRIVISNHQKNTLNTFSDKMMLLYHNTECLSNEFYTNLKKYKNQIDKHIDYDRDFSYDYFAFKTLEKAYLLKIKSKIIERPQDMLMRVSLFLHGNTGIDKVLRCYNFLSNKYFIHATPTLFHAGSPKSQLLSCFLIGTKDSIKGIYKTITDCAQISKWAGGIGVHVSNIRAGNSLIRGTNGRSDGIIPMLKVYNSTALYVNQCILPDIIVYSKGGFKRMDEITTNDYLITKDGSFKKVNEIIINQKNEEILHIKTQHGIDPLKCTKIHDILTIKFTRRNGFKRTIDKLDRGVYKMKFIKADELTQEHLLGFPIPTYENDIDNFTEDNARMYGIILGDGSVIHHKKGQKGSSRYQISLNNDSKSDTMDFVLNYLEDRNIHYWINNEAEVCWTYNPVNIKKINITEEMIYDENREKILIPSFLHLPKNKIAMILKGLIETDGCITSSGIWFMSTSKNLIYSTKYLLLRFGILASVQTVDKVGQTMSYNKHNRPIISRKILYSLRMPKVKILKENNIYSKDFKEAKIKQYFTYDNIIWSRVKEITKSDYSGKVYDFNMEDNHNYLTDNGLVHNSGKRAGSFAIYLETWHADIFEFLDLKKTHGDMEKRALDLFYAMWISDLFMERVEKDEMWSLFSPDEAKGLTDVYGDEFEELYVKYEKEGIARKTVNARKLWNAILTAQIETGTPYLLCKDAANRKTNQKNLGTIKSSNLCVSPETLILTDKGHMEIQELEGQNVNVWNGLEFSNTKVFKTGINQELMEVTFSNGCSLTCTPYHKFYIQEKFIRNKKDIINHKNVKTIEAQHLKPDMKLIKCEFPVIDGKEELKYAYTNGFFSGDGTYRNIYNKQIERKCSYKSLNNKAYCGHHIAYQVSNEISEYCQALSKTKNPYVYLYGEKTKLLEHLDYISHGKGENDCLCVKLNPDLKEKFFVPVRGYSIKSKMEWLAGIADADGTIGNGGITVYIFSIHKEFLFNIYLMLQECGCNSTIKKKHDSGKRYWPNRNKTYKMESLWMLTISSVSVQKLLKFGFNPKRLKLVNRKIKADLSKFVKITNTKKLERKADTYCFTESKRHAGIFNGVIASNCAEILEYSDDKEYGCCTLASIGLPKFVEDGKFNYEKLMEVVEIMIDNLNIIIDKNFYPVPETKLSNKRHRPLGLGVQGLADTFVLLRYPFDSPEAKQLNNDIFECIYYTALRKSCELSKRDGPYSTFKGSPLSEGKFQFDLWDEELKNISYKRTFEKTKLSDKYDWEGLRKDIMEHGVRNSLLLAMMPTASTGQILGNTECIEPITSNIYTRGTSSGTFVVVNKFLINDLIKENLWSPEMKTRIIRNRGSIQTITEIPLELRKLYKTSWDLKMKVLIDMATDRAKYIDQTQSMNLFIENPTIRKLSSMYFYAYRKGLKTLVYYLRQKSPAFAQQFSVEPVVTNKETFVEEIKEKEEKENTFLKKVFLKEKNKTTTATKSLGKDDEELEAVKQLMCSIKNGPNCESCMG